MYCFEFQESSVAKLGSVCRRVYRIFSHAYFHHRQIFEAFESDTHLCRRFTVFVTKYKLMTRDNLIVPILEGEEENVTVVAPNTTTGVVPQGESEAWIKNLLLPRFVIVFPLQVVQKIHVFKNTSNNANQINQNYSIFIYEKNIILLEFRPSFLAALLLPFIIVFFIKATLDKSVLGVLLADLLFSTPCLGTLAGW